MATPLLDLARKDPVVAPLALLQAEALRAAAEPIWQQAAPTLAPQLLREGVPLLHGRTLRPDRWAVRALLLRLAEMAAASGAAGAGDVHRALAADELDALAVLEASIALDAARLERIATAAGVAAGLLSTLAQVAAIPLLHPCGEKAADILAQATWEAGCCPVCAAWPLLAEVRGIERRLFLRCGRCGSGWSCRHQRCVYCGNGDHRSLGYLAPEADRESRRVATCAQCHGYIKTLATIRALGFAEVLMQDMLTVELDLAAVEQGYTRTPTPAARLALRVEPA